MKKIAVILVNYNGLKDSIECIKSIFESDCKEDVTVIFVDNASNVDEAKLIQEKFKESIVTIRSNINGGFSAGNNIGIRYALRNKFEYVMLLNNDTGIDRQLISKLTEQCCDTIVTVPRMLYYTEPDRIWYGGGVINRWTGNAKHLHMNQLEEPEKERIVTFATGCCMMIAAKTFEKVGLLDDRYFMYCEDTDFCIRLRNRNVEIKYIPSAKLWHKVSSSTGGSNSPFSTYYITRNRFTYLREHKEYFHVTAYPFSLITRYIRMIQCKDSYVREAYRRAIKDAKVGVLGRSIIY